MSIAWFVHALDADIGRQIVREFEEVATEARFPAEPRVTWAQPGQFEDLTLNRARAWALENPDGFVLYTHTKGAYHNSFYVVRATGKAITPGFNDLWRMAMSDRLIGPWPSRIADLREHDAAGLFWITAESNPEFTIDPRFGPHFGGNFWWARADYLARLPELPRLTKFTREQAEMWLGSGNPKVRALTQGYEALPLPGIRALPEDLMHVVGITAEEAERNFAAGGGQRYEY
jgi:hypothetical protein